MDEDRAPLSEKLGPWAYAGLCFGVCAVAGIILLAIGLTFIGIIVGASSIIVGLVAWLVAQ